MTTGSIPVNLPRGIAPNALPAGSVQIPGQTTQQAGSSVHRNTDDDANTTAQLNQHDAPATATSRLSEAEQRLLAELRVRDRVVRTHEQAHLAAAGNLASGGASFTLQRGPDGKQYATGGEVSIDSARVAGDPEATIERAQQVRRAALAPANPSAQDRSVAAAATATELRARAELAEKQRAENQENLPSAGSENTVVASQPEIDTFV